MVVDPYKARKSWSSRTQVLQGINFITKKVLVIFRNDRDCKVFVQNNLSRHNKKTDATAQLYCTLSTQVTPKTISRQSQKKKKFDLNKKIRTKLTFSPQQKNDTTAQLYYTLSMYVTPKTISRQNQTN